MDALPNHRRSWKEKRLRKPGRNMIMISSRLGDCKFGGLECEGFADQDSIVCGLYINITLHDYLRTIVNLNSTNTTWTLVGQKLPPSPPRHCRGRQTRVCLGLLFILKSHLDWPPNVTSRLILPGSASRKGQPSRQNRDTSRCWKSGFGGVQPGL